MVIHETLFEIATYRMAPETWNLDALEPVQASKEKYLASLTCNGFHVLFTSRRGKYELSDLCAYFDSGILRAFKRSFARVRISENFLTVSRPEHVKYFAHEAIGSSAEVFC